MRVTMTKDYALAITPNATAVRDLKKGETYTVTRAQAEQIINAGAGEQAHGSDTETGEGSGEVQE